MDKNKTTKILNKYLSGRFSAEKERLVQQWIIKESDQKEKEQASLDYWDELEVKADGSAFSAYKRVESKIAKTGSTTVIIPLYKKLLRVAAILIPLFIIAGGYHYYTSVKHNMTEISVAYGEDKHLFLPDGSEIWINAGSTIKYPNELGGPERLVHLDGEAYFSVIKDESRPFIVRTKALSVKVLGTKFNVKAYSCDEKAMTTLASGKVEVTTNTNVSKILKPNEHLIFNKTTSDIGITEVTTVETGGWIIGQIIFDNVSHKEIMQTLERRFNIVIEDKTGVPDSKLYTIKFVKNESLDEIMSVLEELIGFSCERNNNKLILLRSVT